MGLERTIEGLSSHVQMFLLIISKHVAIQIGYHQVIREEHTNGEGIHINYIIRIKFLLFKFYTSVLVYMYTLFRHHLCIPQESSDDGLYGLEYVVLINKKMYVMVTFPFLFVDCCYVTVINMQPYNKKSRVNQVFTFCLNQSK